MNRNNIQSRVMQARDSIRNLGYKGAAAVTVFGASMSPAFAQSLGEAFTSEADGAKSELLIIGGAVLAVVAIIFLIKSAKRSAS
ncbi:hypothetical protein [Coralloluteibacterium thermophilus]|uniref:Uncharacterized protein n=1 Tax=Coralloluteibacterium thermophilum TaxID=2707049 RepID=A0ABV9NM96_9GAMM